MLVHNARVHDDRPLIETPPSRWHEAVHASATALLLLVQDLVPGMRERGWGRVLAVSVQDAAVRDRGPHGLTKALLLMMCEALALELAPEIAVNTISPGLIADYEGLGASNRQDAVERTPLRQLVTRIDLAQALVALCSPPFDTLTGQDLRLDGDRVIPQLFPKVPATD